MFNITALDAILLQIQDGATSLDNNKVSK